jgi:UDPglucose 6-dehydrogenase/UDP-N-acetyl-D-galactosamine dehydrogenase
LEKESNFILGKDFFIGYSPERVNPGDEFHTIDKITKIVSGMNNEITEILKQIYETITNVYIAKDIKTAEAAKVIENIQRDLNIALTNELSIIFHKLGLSSKDVFEAASTKWNFINFSPGLVGGHCIPVDPYYLVYKTKEIGYHPQVILAGRSVNNSMTHHVTSLLIEGLNTSGKIIENSKVLIMGLTYKENVADTRESPVKELVMELNHYSMDIYGHDPLLSSEEIKSFNIKAVEAFEGIYDAIIITVAHDNYKALSLDVIKNMINGIPVLVDVRGIFSTEAKDKNFFTYYTL